MLEVTHDGTTVKVEFTGSALGLFGRYLLASVLSLFVIPAPWMIVWLNRWMVGKLHLSDGSQVAFTGKAKDVWFPVIMTMVLALVGQLAGSVNGEQEEFAAFALFLPLLLLPLNYYFALVIARWFFGNLQPGCGTKVSFTGKYLPYLGWNLLLQISIFSIIGWAWVSVGMLNWWCRNIHGEGHIVEFHGNGWNVLWRTLVFTLSCLFIIPIPWTVLWLVRWYTSNITISKVSA
jgi:hypothetical protein